MYLFEIKTVQTSAFKTLIEALKEILTDTNIEISEQGMKILALDSTKTTLVYLKLEAAKFDYYKCSKTTVAGISMINLFKFIKTASNEDTLSLFIDDALPNILQLKFEHNDKKMVSTKKLNLIDLNEDDLKIPPAEFDCVITMPSQDFQKQCRDKSIISDVIEIKSVGNKLIFACRGDIGEDETSYGSIGDDANKEGLKFNKVSDPSRVIQGYYKLKYLTMFSKCTSLCANIEICMKNDYPIIITYSVGNLGKLRLALAPKKGED